MTMLPNMRLLCLPSEHRGEDWWKKSQEVDDALASANLDLAEESVYLLFNQVPEIVLDGEGECLVGRSVIGPKRQQEGELRLVDWEARAVFIEEIHSSSWEKVLQMAQGHWESIHSQEKLLQPRFMLRLRRSLKTHLRLTVEAIFQT